MIYLFLYFAFIIGVMFFLGWFLSNIKEKQVNKSYDKLQEKIQSMDYVTNATISTIREPRQPKYKLYIEGRKLSVYQREKELSSYDIDALDYFFYYKRTRHVDYLEVVIRDLEGYKIGSFGLLEKDYVILKKVCLQYHCQIVDSCWKYS